EKKWFSTRVPRLPVEYVGNPIFDRYPPADSSPSPPCNGGEGRPARRSLGEGGGEVASSGAWVVDRSLRQSQDAPNDAQPPVVLLLPGSRRGELRRHTPVMVQAARAIAARQEARFILVVPNEELAGVARTFLSNAPPRIDLQIGGLQEALLSATVALAKSGTITLECAFFRVPAIVIYKTDWGTYLLGRWLVHVKYLSMPNLLAGEAVYPEFIQGRAAPDAIAAAILDLLNTPARREEVRAKLGQIIQTLGGPGAARRAAAAIITLMGWGRVSDEPKKTQRGEGNCMEAPCLPLMKS
ncbi:MAG: hypothetical protein ABSA47_12355, partial [Verrucomicrobiota bacterium]